jgi:hypothetical protein
MGLIDFPTMVIYHEVEMRSSFKRVHGRLWEASVNGSDSADNVDADLSLLEHFLSLCRRKK